MDEVWSEHEFAAAVDAYLGMLKAEADGRPLDISTVRTRLLDGPLASRTPSSFEYRMRNISAVLELLDRPHLKRFTPARNVGARGTAVSTVWLASTWAHGFPMNIAPTSGGWPISYPFRCGPWRSINMRFPTSGS
jgi:hypothetical protein